VQEATVVIKNIFRKYPNQYESIITTLCEHLDSLDEPEAKAAMIWIIGQYADRIENSDVLLDDFLFSFKEETYEVQLALLTATVKLFIQRPTKGSELVPRVLRWATEESDHPDLRERGFFYWRLLSFSDTALVKQVVMGQKPPITAESEKLDPSTLEEMCLNVGTLATVYLKPVNQVFRNARSRRLQDSPALQRHRLPTAQLVSPKSATSRNALSGSHRGGAINGNHTEHGNLAAAVDAADEYFSSVGSRDMSRLQVGDDNFLSPGIGEHDGMNSHHYHAPFQPSNPDGEDLLLF